MHVNVVYALTRIGSVVDHQPVSRVRNAELPRKFAPGKHQATHQFRVIIAQPVDCRYVLARNDKHMDRRTRIDVVKGDGMLVLMRQLRGN